MYPDDFSQYASSQDAVIFSVLGVLMVFWLIVSVFSIVLYILRCAGLHRLAKRRQIRHAWLAWIPVGNAWVLGSVSDQYRYVAKRQDTNRRLILLILAGVTSLSGGFSGIRALSNLISYGPDSIASALVALLGTTALSGLAALAFQIFRYIATYDLYASCKPQNAALFLVLSILFPVTEPFFLFCLRNCDGGMPARRPAYRQPTPEAEPWERVEN